MQAEDRHTAGNHDFGTDIQLGMRVVDGNGAEVGKVVAVIAPAGAQTDRAPSEAERKLSKGGIRIDAAGWGDADRFADIDQIAMVSGEHVYLTIPRDELIPFGP